MKRITVITVWPSARHVESIIEELAC